MVKANRLVERRKSARLTQGQLAQECGRSVATLRRWERGKGRPDIDALVLLARRLGCNPLYLCGVADAYHDLGWLSLDEIRLVRDYRAANDAMRAMMFACLADAGRVLEVCGGGG